MRTLLLLRHAKSDWDHAGLADIDRPLNKRGQKAAQRMGQWMDEHDIAPASIICSPACRARETLAGVRQHLNLDDDTIRYEERLYLADLNTLLSVLADAGDNQAPVMLIGHNPGMDDLLTYLCGTDLPLSAGGKLMATATLADIQLPDNWHDLSRQSGELKQIIRPKEINHL